MARKYQHLEGMSELERAFKELQELTGKNQKAVLRRAVVKSGNIIRDAARHNSPWPNTSDEGNIKSATDYRDSKGGRHKLREPKTSVFAYVYDPHPLAPIFESGTVDRYQKSTTPARYTGVIQPHLYMRSATDTAFQSVVRTQSVLLGEEIKKAFNKHIKKTGG